MAWSLVGRGTWGVTARMSIEFRRPVPIGRRDPRRGPGRRGQPAALPDDRARSSIRETGEVLATAEGRYVAAPPERLARAEGALRLRPVDGAESQPPRRRWTRSTARRGRRRTASGRAADASPTRRSAARAPSWPTGSSGPRPSGGGLAEPGPGPGRASRPRLRAALRGARRSRVPRRASASSPRGSGPTHGVRTPLLGAARPRLPRRDAARFAGDAPLRRRSAARRAGARGPLVRDRDPRADAPPRAGAHLAAPPAGGREADDWITVDTLAHPVGKGILAEPYRWAELEQLVYAPSRWERRLVGSTIATIPFVDRTAGRDPSVAAPRPRAPRPRSSATPSRTSRRRSRGPPLDGARRPRGRRPPPCEAEAERAAATADGHRAWVVRDALAKLDPADAAAPPGPPRRASAAGPARRRPPSPPRRPPASPALPPRPGHARAAADLTERRQPPVTDETWATSGRSASRTRCGPRTSTTR